MASQSSVSFIEQREGDFWVDALIGAVLTVLLSFIPLSPLLGGGVAGYLYRGSRMAGAKIGAVSGLLAALPAFALIGIGFGGIGFGMMFQVGTAGTAVFWAIMIFALVMLTIVAGGLGAIGGYIGAVIHERDEDDQFRIERDQPRTERSVDHDSAAEADVAVK